MRAREPDSTGYVDRDGVKVAYEVFGDGADDRDVPAGGHDRATPGRGRRRCPTWPGTTAWSRSTRGATAARTGPPTRRPTTTPSRSATPSRCSTSSASTGPCSSASASAPGWRWSPRACTRTGSRAWSPSRRGAGRHAAAAVRADAAARFDDVLAGVRRLVQVQPAPLARGLAGLRGLLLRPDCCEPHSTKQLEDAVEYALRDHGRGDGRGRGRRALRRDAPRRPSAAARRPLPGAGRRGHRGPVPAARPLRHGGPADRRRAAGARGRRAPADGPRAGRGQPRRQGVRGPGHRDRAALRAPGPGARPADRHGCSTSPRRSGSGTSAATSRSPARCGRQRPDVRGRVADPVPRRRLPRAGRRGRAPGVAVPGQRVGAPRVRVRRARPARVPGRAPDGRGAGQQLHGVRRAGRATSTSTCGSATRPGTSTTSCTRTPSSSGRRSRG